MTRGLIKAVRALGTCFVAILCVLSITTIQQQNVRVTFLDVGQGDAILIQTPSGASVLVDGGKDARVLKQLHAYMPYFNRKIDAVIATHPDADHVGGLADVVRRYDVKHVYYTPMKHDTPQVALFEDALRMRNVTQEHVRSGDVLVLDEDVFMHVLHPAAVSVADETNSTSVVLRLIHKDVSFLLTGDAPADIEHQLASAYGNQLKSTVLKLGHHGSYTSTSEVLLGYVHPSYAVISRGCDNEYGHPHAEVINRLEEFRISSLDTCVLGSIQFESTGFDVRVIH